MKPVRQPTLYLPHGGGPWPFVPLPGRCSSLEVEALAGFLHRWPEGLPERPKAILVVSAHWESTVPTVMAASKPPLLFDYSGFPAEAYELTWPAPGDSDLAHKVRHLLAGAGFDSQSDGSRGFDHGTFVPLKVMFPNADMPVVQLSLLNDLNPSEHWALGEALAPLRDEGVLIIGSGFSFHNQRLLNTQEGQQVSWPFDIWLREQAVLPRPKRKGALCDWISAPNARLSHPREEHLLPLMVVAGAAGNDGGQVVFNGQFARCWVSAIQYG